MENILTCLAQLMWQILRFPLGNVDKLRLNCKPPDATDKGAWLVNLLAELGLIDLSSTVGKLAPSLGKKADGPKEEVGTQAKDFEMKKF